MRDQPSSGSEPSPWLPWGSASPRRGRRAWEAEPRGWCWLSAPSLCPFSRLVREFIRQFNLKLNPFIQRDNNTWYFLKGNRVRTEEADRNPDILNYTVKPSERGKSATQLYREVLDKVRGSPVGSPHLSHELGNTWP